MSIAIIGGGASGMMLASMLKNRDLTLFEKNQKLGKKLLMTGNGKCNFTSGEFDDLEKIYNNDFACAIYKKYDNDACIRFYNEIGVEAKQEIHKGITYYYPCSNKATSVYYDLLDKIIDNNVAICVGIEVVDIKKENDKFVITYSDDKTLKFDKVVIATGGASYKNTGSDGSGYIFAKRLGHRIVDTIPGLCALKSKDLDLKELKNVRVDGTIIYNDFKEKGEIQFTEYGISGIPVYNLSRYVSRDLSKNSGAKCEISIRFIDSDFENTYLFLSNRKDKLGYKLARDFLCGFLPDELSRVIIKRASVNEKKQVADLSDNDLQNIARNILSFVITIDSFADFDNAQITLGGVDTRDVNVDTLESKIVKGLYFTGEVLDIDGKCGGYNLQLCFSTAKIVSENI